MTTIKLLVLFAVMTAAVWSDISLRKIPNRLVVAATLLGFAGSAMAEGIGLAQAAGGFALGFAALLPLYALHAMGAGDVKLMAAVGTFLGVKGVLIAVVATFAAGGLLAIAFGLHAGTLRQALGNIRLFVYQCAMRLAGAEVARDELMPVTHTRLPYSVAIASGVTTYFAAMYYYTGALS